MWSIRFVCSLGAILLLAGCTVLAPPATIATPASQILLDSGDQLQITVLGQTDLSGAYGIDSAGVLTMPLIGTIDARGRTTQSLANAIETELQRGFLRNPDVTIQVTQYRPVFVLGEVSGPGQFSYLAGLTVQQAVALAGGFTARANRNQIDVVRPTGSGTTIDLRLQLSDAVLPGDTLTIRQRLF
ncbi:MAG: polysaccharide biosynthesis/export family protein [Alphaproteobacteria bacterium]